MFGTECTNDEEYNHKYNRTCRKCGSFEKGLHEHHIYPTATMKKLGIDIPEKEDRILLCRKCHVELHIKLLKFLKKISFEDKKFVTTIINFWTWEDFLCP